MKSLVIVESPSKAKTIKKYLGENYEVQASKGHIVDLPKSTIAIDVENGYKPDYVVTKRESLKQLKTAFKDKQDLILAVDPDREGEAIGWHLAQRLGVINTKGKIKEGYRLSRIVFTSITKDSIQEAIKSPRSLDMNLVNAQQARRVLDRLVGYELSPLLWKKISFGLSAGRVQSVAVRLIVEREEERERFIPEEYWTIEVDVKVSKSSQGLNLGFVRSNNAESLPEYSGIKFGFVECDGKKVGLNSQSDVEKIFEKIQNADWVVDGVATKETRKQPKPPFTTSTLQQTASNKLGYSAKKTMSVAQKLYESGLITYMRTDSTNMSEVALQQIRDHISTKFGKGYLTPKPVYYKTSSKVAQEAHECIRPANVGVSISDYKLDSDEKKLYELIFSRAVGSQMNPAVLEVGNIDLIVNNCKFRATGQTLKFDGYLKVYHEKLTNNPLPENIKIGDILYPENGYGIQHFTEPKGRYTEATLIKVLEFYGIGRPSTYVPIISTILARKYVEKLGKVFVPTDTGRIVNKLLEDHFAEIVDYEFTAQVENNLDDIAEGKIDWVKMLDNFYIPFHKKLIVKDKEIDRADYTVLGDAPKDIVCPLCGKPMKAKLGRFGRFYSCSMWPDCKGMLGLDGKSEKDYEQEAYSDEFLKFYNPAPKTDKGVDYKLKRGKYGKFWAHPDYPKVKDAKPLEYRNEIKLKIYGNPPIAKDKSEMVLMRGRFGEFWAHPDYPKVKEVVRIDKKEIKNAMQSLGL